MVSGEPAPVVRWERDNSKLDDPEIYITRYDERAQEHILEVRFAITKKKRFTPSTTFFCKKNFNFVKKLVQYVFPEINYIKRFVKNFLKRVWLMGIKLWFHAYTKWCKLI